jgi:hypothetical protein
VLLLFFTLVVDLPNMNNVDFFAVVEIGKLFQTGVSLVKFLLAVIHLAARVGTSRALEILSDGIILCIRGDLVL